MRTLAALMIVMCAACAGRTDINVGGGATPTTQSSVQVQGGSGFATLFGLAILGVMAYDYEVNGVRYRGNPFITVTDNVPQAAPELAPARKVNEQDCTRPIADWSANLKCR